MRFSLILCVMLVGASLTLTKHPRTSTFIPITTFDEYGNICWGDEQARLDNFSIELHNSPELVGYVTVYAGRISCRDEAKYRGNRARNHLLKRGVVPKQVIFKDGGYRPDVQTVLHLQPKAEPDYEVKPTLSKDEVSIKRCFDKVFAKVICLDRQ